MASAECRIESIGVLQCCSLVYAVVEYISNRAIGAEEVEVVADGGKGSCIWLASRVRQPS